MLPSYIPAEHTLLEKNVKGLKKLSNFLKREEERQAWWVACCNVEQYVHGIEQYHCPQDVYGFARRRGVCSVPGAAQPGPPQGAPPGGTGDRSV